jgi:dihydrofolate synthase / folylpolyglutamate synthase
VDSGLTSYKAAVDALFARTGSTAKFGLERTSRFLEILGDPHRRFDSFHVAGTNGKGSVVITLYELLRSRHFKVGRYMSPHLIDFRERIVVDGAAIPESYVVDFLERCSGDAAHMGATFFEITTAMAFHYFAERNVDVAVIETGLGGRLDSTNVITPVVAGVTSIGLDHQEYLGNDAGSIACEKAGIFKPGVPAVAGAIQDPDARAALLDVARAVGAPLIKAHDRYSATFDELTYEGTTFTVLHDGESRRMTSGLIGPKQIGNACTALTMLEAAGPRYSVPLDEAAHVLPRLRLPGRFDRKGNIILDVAHNPDGIAAIGKTFDFLGHPDNLTVILGVLSDKDWRGMISQLTWADRLVTVLPPTAPNSRAWDPVEAARFAVERGIHAIAEPDFQKVVLGARDEQGMVLITGSFHTVGDAMEILGHSALT